MQRIDLNETNFTNQGQKLLVTKPVHKEVKPLETNPEARHHQIQDSISAQVTSFANEPSLQTVIRKSYFKEKETIKRGNLARLLQSNKT